MKINKITSLFMIAVLFLFTACDPIVDEEVLENSTSSANVELVATQSTPGGNEVTLKMVTKGVTGHWDYNLGKAFTDRVTIVYPIPGNSTFTFNGTLGAEFFSKTIDVQIDVLDTPLDQDWYDLVSTNTSTGKTWVFDKSGPFWYMAPPGSKDGWQGIWWDASCCSPDPDGSMKFDLNGAANITYMANPTATPETGSFVLDVANQALQFNGRQLLGYDGAWGNPAGKYEIVSLTEDKLVLFVGANAGGTGWTWVYKPQ